MDGYLKEGEEKSKELDRGNTPTGTKGLPPPPRRVNPAATTTVSPPPVDISESQHEERKEGE